MERIIDLTKKSTAAARSDIKKFQQKAKLLTSFKELKKGDIIEFWGGYNGDIRYRAEIIGFDKDGDIYLDWDSYWFPIRDDNKRKIKNTTAKNASLNKPAKPKSKPTPAQLAARIKFSEMAKNGTLAKKRPAGKKPRRAKS